VYLYLFYYFIFIFIYLNVSGVNAELLKLRIWRDDKFMRRPTANCTIVALSATCFIDFFSVATAALLLKPGRQQQQQQ